MMTSIKDARLQELQQMWAAFDLKMRTYGSLVFDTREEAQLARDTYQVFMTQFNTMDLDQSANLVILDQYIATSLPGSPPCNRAMTPVEGCSSGNSNSIFSSAFRSRIVVSNS